MKTLTKIKLHLEGKSSSNRSRSQNKLKNMQRFFLNSLVLLIRVKILLRQILEVMSRKMTASRLLTLKKTESNLIWHCRLSRIYLLETRLTVKQKLFQNNNKKLENRNRCHRNFLPKQKKYAKKG